MTSGTTRMGQSPQKFDCFARLYDMTKTTTGPVCMYFVFSTRMKWPRPRGNYLSVFLCLQNQHPLRMKILRGMMKYAHNTYDGRIWMIPLEDKLFYFWKRRWTAVSLTANDGACWVRAHTLWLKTEWPALEILSIVVVPGLAKSLSWELAPFENWRLTYTLTTTKKWQNRVEQNLTICHQPGQG